MAITLPQRVQRQGLPTCAGSAFSLCLHATQRNLIAIADHSKNRAGKSSLTPHLIEIRSRGTCRRSDAPARDDAVATLRNWGK
jgi:hypothetical protein